MRSPGWTTSATSTRHLVRAALATLPGMSIAGFSLLDSGDIVAWGTPIGNTSALALGLIDGSAGVALQPPAVATTKYVPVVPRRILDTRDGIGAPAGIVGEGGQIDVQIAGVGSVPAIGVAAVVLNVTATEATQAGYVSVYPSGTRRPLVSSLNLEAIGQTVANLVTVKVGTNGKVTLFTSGGTHLVADLAGLLRARLGIFGRTPADLDTANAFSTHALAWAQLKPSCRRVGNSTCRSPDADRCPRTASRPSC